MGILADMILATKYAKKIRKEWDKSEADFWKRLELMAMALHPVCFWSGSAEKITRRLRYKYWRGD